MAQWTDDRVALLRKLYAEGQSSSSMMADRIGGVTRNAVIGKLHRLGLIGRTVTVRRSGSLSLPLNTTRVSELTEYQHFKRRRRGEHVSGVSVPKLRKLHAALSAPSPQVQSEPMPPEQAPTSTPVTFDQLEARHCRFAFGRQPPYTFCGAQRAEGSSYCGFHHAACHTGTPRWTSPKPLFQPIGKAKAA